MDKLPSLLTGERLERLYCLAESVPLGAFVEVGVYQGGSAEVLYRVAEKRGRELWLYDTFSGIPFASQIDRHQIGDFGDCIPLEYIQSSFPNAIIQEGIFPHGMRIPEKIALVHLDCDQYQSYRDSLDALLPKMTIGGMIVCDDYCLQGAARAIDETKWNKDLLDNGQLIFRC